MKGERPINADESAADLAAKAGEEKKQKQAESPAKAETAGAKPTPPSGRRPASTALKLIGGAVLVAIVFIVAAILGSGDEPSQPQGPAPTVPGESRSDEPEEPAEQSATELGYPAFATANTTRIGGSDPASNAAAAALAVYPSAEPSQQPQAVTLVGEGDWQAAIAAAVLTAEPVGAPILFSGPDGAPGPTVEALEALEPRGGGDTGGAGAFVVGDVAQPEGEVTRVEGSGPGAAAAIAALREKLVDSAPRHYVVAPEDPIFAMPAAAWAARSGDPVLFAGKDDLPKPTAAALRRHPKVPVYVLGPASAISSAVIREIGKVGGQVRRVSGEDPVANAIAFARYADGEFGWNVNDPGHGFVVARYDSTLDAAAAAPLSAAGTWGPLLLTASGATLPPALRDYLLDVKPGYTTDPTRAFYNHVWVIGDLEAIDAAQQAEIDELAALAKIGGGSE